MKSGKQHITEGIELPNQIIIRTLGEKETYKYLEIFKSGKKRKNSKSKKKKKKKKNNPKKPKKQSKNKTKQNKTKRELAELWTLLFRLTTK